MEEDQLQGGINVIAIGSLGGGIITNWFPYFNNLVETQVNLIATTLTTVTSPIFSLLNNHHPKPPPEPQPSQVVRRVGYGLLGAVYTGMVLTMVMAAAVTMGVLVVNYWAEEPVFVREKLHFDYTDVNPEAVVDVILGRGRSGGGGGGVPVGHRVHISVMLLVPDSDYNRDIGVFQLMAEVVSTNGRIIARSSQPSMLQFHSHPIRLMRTFLMGLPLLFGFTRETQKITVQMLRYKEDSLLRTESIKITIMPRAGTSYLPQLYEAELLLHSKLPRVKELIHNWKWTLYVWVSLYIYIVLLLLLVCFFKPLLAFPALRVPGVGEHHEGGVSGMEREETPKGRKPEEREFAETLRKWQQYRRKRKAELLSRSFVVENINSASASSYIITKDDIGLGMEEDVADSESVCLGGFKSC